MLGPNGAGKSTLMRAIMGLVANSGDGAAFAARRCRASRRTRCAARGVVLVPEGRGIFAPMTVAENLELGAYLLNDAAEFERRRERVFDAVSAAARAARARSPARCPAASSRCWRSAAR